MDKILKRTLLYDFYNELLTDKQKQIYSLYYDENLSLTEISEKLKITRQAVSDSLNKTKQNFDYYEKKLGLIKKFKKFDTTISKLDELLKQEIIMKKEIYEIKNDIEKLKR